MIAYNKEHLDNTYLVAEAESLQNAGFIGKEQYNKAEAELTSYNMQSNALIRAGLFLLGTFLFSSCCGLFAAMFGSAMNDNYEWLVFIYAAFGFIATEFLIHSKKYFANGLDDAFLFCSQVCVLIFVGIIVFDKLNSDVLYPLYITGAVIGVIACIRYVDSLSALMACVGITAFIANLLIDAGTVGRSVLPFALMLLAGGIFYLYVYLKKTITTYTYYEKSLRVCFAFALVLFYCAGNYLVVREATVELLDAEIAPGTDISLAWFFYAFTFITPLAYIYFSLVQKDRLMLWVGILALAFSIYTIRHYYSVMPIEVALTGGGVILFGIVFIAIRKLKNKTEGITYEPDKFLNSDNLLNAEIISTAAQFSVKPGMESKDSGYSAGGGQFGGGGAGNSF